MAMRNSIGPGLESVQAAVPTDAGGPAGRASLGDADHDIVDAVGRDAPEGSAPPYDGTLRRGQWRPYPGSPLASDRAGSAGMFDAPRTDRARADGLPGDLREKIDALLAGGIRDGELRRRPRELHAPRMSKP